MGSATMETSAAVPKIPRNRSTICPSHTITGIYAKGCISCYRDTYSAMLIAGLLFTVDDP